MSQVANIMQNILSQVHTEYLLEGFLSHPLSGICPYGPAIHKVTKVDLWESFHKMELHLMTRESPDTNYQNLFPRILKLRPRAFSLGTGPHIQSGASGSLTHHMDIRTKSTPREETVHTRRRNQRRRENSNDLLPSIPDPSRSPVAFVPLNLTDLGGFL